MNSVKSFKLLGIVASIVLALPVGASSYIIRAGEPVPGERVVQPPNASSWEDIGEAYDCSEGTPLAIDIKNGTSFTQSLNCHVEQQRTVTYVELDEFSGEVVSSREEVEQQIASVTLEQDAIGTGMGNTCSEAYALGFRDSGRHTFNNGSYAYCEQKLLGGGYRRITSNLYSNGDFAGGSHSGNQTISESNPTNTITYMKNPTGSNYVIHQTGSSTHEYQMDLIGSQLSNHRAGRYMSLSLWTLNPNRWLTHNRMHFSSNNPVADSGQSMVMETKVVDGRTWHRVKYLAKIPYETMTRHNWFVGYQSGGDSYFTGLTHEIYAKD